MNRAYKYEQGGATGDPKPPAWMANDSKFANVTFEGDVKQMSEDRDFLDFDFSYVFDGAKIYGMDGGNSLFIVDNKGNVFQADSWTNNQGDLLDHIESLGAKVDEGFDLRAHGPKSAPEGTQSKNTKDLLQNLSNQKIYEQGGTTSKGKPNLVLPRESEGEVRQTEDGREYVMYRNEDTGEMVKVFGSWNEAPRVRERDEQGMGRFMAIDTSFNYPVTQNENGEFILDEAMLDTEQEGDGPKMVYDEKMGRKMPVAPVGNLLKQLEQQGPGYSGVDKFSPTVRRGINMRNGGRTYRFE